MADAQLNLPLLTGPLLIFISVAFMLFGVFCAQVFYYWNTYSHDSSRLRAYVLAVCLLETTHTAFCLHVLYTYFVVDVTNLVSIGHIIWSTGLTVLLEVLIVSMTEGFYIFRVYRLSEKNLYVTMSLTVLLICRVSFGLATGILTYRFDTWTGFSESHAAATTLNCGLALGAAVDMLCAAALSFYLRRHQSKFRRTKDLIHTLMFYAINTGAITMVSSLAILFMFNFLHTSLMFAGMVEVVSKLYANSMLALLNARNKIKTTSSDSNNLHSIPLSLRGNFSDGSRTLGGVRVDIVKDSEVTESVSGDTTLNDKGSMP